MDYVSGGFGMPTNLPLAPDRTHGPSENYRFWEVYRSLQVQPWGPGGLTKGNRSRLRWKKRRLKSKIEEGTQKCVPNWEGILLNPVMTLHHILDKGGFHVMFHGRVIYISTVGCLSISPF